MKLFKNTLAIVALFAIGSVNARIAHSSMGTPAKSTINPVVQPTNNPVIQPKTPDFYDAQTEMLKDAFLNEKVNYYLAQGKTAKETQYLLKKDLIKKMHNEWVARKKTKVFIANFTDNVKAQIDVVVMQAEQRKKNEQEFNMQDMFAQ